MTQDLATLFVKRKFHVYVGNSHLGQGELAVVETVRQGFGIYSLAYFCEHCGEVWARTVIEKPAGGIYIFSAIALPCERHPPPFRTCVAGSLLLEWDRAYNDALPRGVWHRELQIHLAHYDRFGGKLDFS